MTTNQISRRSWLQTSTTALTSVAAWKSPIIANAATLRTNAKACILLWMGGGPSQFETFSPKPDHTNGGGTTVTSTAVSGIQISSQLPATAAAMKDVCLIRSVHGPEGSHPRASYVSHTGYLPTASVKHPAIGAHVAQHIGDRESELPSFVHIGRSRGVYSAGLLGVQYDPFILNSANQMPANTELSTSKDRYVRRLALLENLENDGSTQGSKQFVKANRNLYGKASRLVMSPQMETFDITQESSDVRSSYGDGDFAAGCLMARRLVESGVTFIEVASSNWDTHFDNATRTNTLCQEVDKPYAQLLMDLKQRGLLDTTLVIWMGEFGRSPRINGRGGRDHYPRAFNVALAGAGVQGGQVLGATDASGNNITDQPVSVNDLLTTIYDALGIDSFHENMSRIGRPIRIVEDGEIIDGVF
jgi:hypothetical protein